MKKTLIIIPAVALGVFFALGRSVAQEPILFYDPIPVATDENHTRVEATHLKFFKAPKAPDGSINFVSDFVTIGGFEPGEGYKVFKNNLVATPGLLPKDQIPVNAFNRMIDDLGSRFQGSTITPIQGFCPESMRVAVLDNQGTVLDVIYFALDCQAHEEGNRTDHQLQVADIRNEFDSAELISLIGADPLVDWVLGSANQVSPYPPDLYPATVRLGEPFKWQFLDAPEPGYQDVIAYGIADLDRGVVTAAYDPLWMRLRYEVSAAYGNQPYRSLGITVGDKENEFDHYPYLSPLIFFRKNTDPGIGRLLWSGYSTIQLPPFTKMVVDTANYSPEDLVEGLRERLLSIDNLFMLFASFNFNPIDVEAMEYHVAGLKQLPLEVTTGLLTPVLPGMEPIPDLVPGPKAKTGIPPDGFGVVNQATVADWDRGLILFGLPFIDVDDQNNIDWFPLSTYFGRRVGDSFQSLDEGLMPHRVFSYAVFWGPSFDRSIGDFRKWGQAGLEQKNPNAVFEPIAMALAPPGVFHIDNVTDVISGVKVDSLLLPSGEPAKDGNYYVYKIDPINGEHLYLRFPQDGSAISMSLPVIIPEVYPIELPEGCPGCAPYGIFAEDDLDGNGCGDMILTFRGQETVALKENFNNEPGQRVVFQVDDNNPSMFASEVKVYFGKREDGRCVFIEDKEGEYTKLLMPRDTAQIAAVTVFDVDGKKAIFLGDMFPHDTPDGKKCTAGGYLYTMLDGRVFSIAPQKIRVGFKESEFCPDMIVGDPSYPRTFAQKLADDEDAEGIFGVAAVDADKYSNLAFVNGWALALPPFGCPPRDAEVASMIELYQSHWNNMAVETLFGDEPLLKEGDYLMPQRCVDLPDLCSVVLLSDGSTVKLPFFAGQKCCDPCHPEGMNAWPDNNCHDTLDKGFAPGVPSHPRSEDIVAHYNTLCGAKCTLSAGYMDLSNLDAIDPCCIDMDADVQWDTDACCEQLSRNPTFCDPTSGDYNSSYEHFCNIHCVQYFQMQDSGVPPVPPSDVGPNPSASNDDKADGKERTEFASAYRPDRVYTTQGHWIAHRADLIPAQAQDVEQREGPIQNLGLDELPFVSGIGPPRVQLQAPRLPRGQRGLGEMTAVLRATMCNRNGTLDPGEECDKASTGDPSCTTAGGLPGLCTMDCKCERLFCSEKDECYTHEQCPDGFCGVDCVCHKSPDPKLCGNGELNDEAGEECDLGYACKEPGQQCLINCACTDASPPMEPTVGNLCECQVLSYSSNVAKDIIERWNADYIQEPSGRVGDERIVEPEQEIMCACCIAGGAVFGKGMEAGGSIQPWMIVQEKGPRFFDVNKEPFKVEVLTDPIRWLPQEEAESKVGKSLTLPDLSASTDVRVAQLSQAAPMEFTSLDLVGGTTVINNMIQHQALAVRPGAELEIKAAGLEDEAGLACHFLRMRMPRDYPAFPGVEPYPEIVPIEQRLLDFKKVRDALASHRLEGRTDIADLPYEPNLNLQISVFQDVQKVEGQEPVEIKLAVLGAPPLLVAEGAAGCKGCYVTSAPATLGSVLPIIAMVAFATGGIVIGRIRRRRR